MKGVYHTVTVSCPLATLLLCANFTHRGGLFSMVQQPPLMLPHMELKVPWNLLEWLVSPLHVEITTKVGSSVKYTPAP